jgi:thiosulfate reductase cytochrome b subunit
MEQEEIPPVETTDATNSPPAPDAVEAHTVAVETEPAADAAVDHALGETLPLVHLPEGEAPVPTAEDMAAEPTSGWKEPPLVLERKHLLAIRWMHWINFPVLFTMIWSGLCIYWNDSDNAYRHPHEVYRVGIGNLTLFRFFPSWFYTNRFWDIRYHVTQGLGAHFFFMWLFAINGILYVAYLLWSREWKFMVPTRKSFAEAIRVTLVDLHILKGLPPQTKYNGAQRIAYTSVILMGAGSLITGLAIYKPTEAHWLTSLLGGYEIARWLHFWLTIGFCAFFLVHVGQVILAGWNNLRAMVSGYEIRRAGEPSLEAERSRF